MYLEAESQARIELCGELSNQITDATSGKDIDRIFREKSWKDTSRTYTIQQLRQASQPPETTRNHISDTSSMMSHISILLQAFQLFQEDDVNQGRQIACQSHVAPIEMYNQLGAFGFKDQPLTYEIAYNLNYKCPQRLLIFENPRLLKVPKVPEQLGASILQYLTSKCQKLLLEHI